MVQCSITKRNANMEIESPFKKVSILMHHSAMRSKVWYDEMSRHFDAIYPTTTLDSCRSNILCLFMLYN